MEKPKKREKYRGVTKGSQSQEQVHARLDLGEQIIKEHQFNITKSDFLKEYKHKVERSSTITTVVDHTLYTDCAKIKKRILEKHDIEFEFVPTSASQKKKFLANIPTIDPFDSISKHLFQIRLVTGSYQNILFSLNNNTFTERNFATNAIAGITQGYMDDKNLEKMAHIYLIYDMTAPHGVENTYCSIYENSGKQYGYVLLYTDAKNHCSEIVCTRANLHNVLDFTFRIFNKYWKNQT